MDKLLVIDGNSIINRAFYGIRALSTADGRPTNAIYGLINIVRMQLEKLQPTYACIAFDVKDANFRKKKYPFYKEGRHPTPPELLAQFPDAKECMRLMGVHTLELPGYEADDILATVSRMAAEHPNTEAYILTGDRDLLQTIAPNVTVLLATNSETVPFTPEHFTEVYGISPSQFVDVKALMGDSSDHIPGVAGIGEKTALRLISCFGSLENIYDNLDHPTIKRGVRDKLAEGKECAEIAKWLVTAVYDAPIGKTLDELRYLGNRAGLYDKLMSLEFRALVRKLGLNESPQISLFEESLPEEKTKSVSKDELLGAIGTSAFAVCPTEDGYLFSCEGSDAVLSYVGDSASLAPLFDGSHEVICYDAKALLHRLHSEGVKCACVPLDVLLYAYLLNPTGHLQTLSSALDSVAPHLPKDSAPLPAPALHAVTRMRLCEPILREAIKEQGMLTLLTEIELPLAPLLTEMEEIGFKIHRRGLSDFGCELDDTIAELTEEIYELAGMTFNINSSKQLGEVLFTKLGLPTAKKTKSGFSTNVETLEKIAAFHPIIPKILEYRHLTKLRSTYVTALLRQADENGRVHTTFKQALTATGRLSSTDPNLQNIPIRTPLGREMRRFFIAEDDDHVLIDADYSQIELRLLAHLSGDRTMIEAFRAEEDIHTKTASLVFGVSENEVTEEMRKRAKAVNFGIVYGIGAFSLSEDLKISTAQAKRYIEDYLATYPSIDVYRQKTVEDAKENGYSETLLGRRRYIPELAASNKNTQAFGCRIAMNSPIQGSATDIIKLAMIRTADRLRSECPEAHLIMQVHDELIVESPRACAESAAKILREEMENAYRVSVPLTVDLTIADNWLGE